MSLNKIYLFSKKIHRIFMLVTILSVLVMSSTGGFLKFPMLAEFVGVDSGLMRYVHNQFSIVLSVLLVIMMTTGLVLYLIPELLKSRSGRQ